MLVLNRKPGESILVRAPGCEKPIKIMVTKVSGKQVGIGLDLPQGWPAVRDEIADKLWKIEGEGGDVQS